MALKFRKNFSENKGNFKLKLSKSTGDFSEIKGIFFGIFSLNLRATDSNYE